MMIRTMGLLMILGLGPGLAAACSSANWSSATGTPQTVDITTASGDGVRYAGLCGLRSTLGSTGFVTTTAPGAEPFIALRFYLYTGSSAGTQLVLRGHPGDSPASGSVFDVTYDAANERFSFLANGTTRLTAAGSAPRNRWIGISVTYAANGSFSATTRHRGNSTTITPIGTGAATIDAVSMGLIQGAGGGSGQLTFDEFEALRSGEPGMLCRGDARGDGILNVFDSNDIQQELHGNAASTGSGDCTEDGRINVLDMACVRRRLLDGSLCSALGRGAAAIFRDGFE